MDFKDYQTCPFTKFDKDWAIVTAGTGDDFNGMTISLGGMGTLWNKPVAFIFVKPVRYTYEFVSRHDEITVAFFDKKYRKALSVFGSKSGRDIDKPQAAGLTPKILAGGGVTYEEATETLVCKKLTMQKLDKDAFPEAAAPFYSLQGEELAHCLVIAEVLEII